MSHVLFFLNYSRNSQLNYKKIGKLPQNAISTNAGEKDFIYTYYMGASDDKTDSFNSVLILSRLTPHLYSPINRARMTLTVTHQNTNLIKA